MIYVCDHCDRLVLAQDGNLRNSNKWAFIKYDELDRPILSGIVTKYYSREALQDSLDLYIEDFFQKFKRGIIAFYAKRWINLDPMTRLPIKLKEMDLIVWFDLYSTEPKVLKQPEHSDNVSCILKDWNNQIEY